MHALVLTIFPDLVNDFTRYGVPRIAISKGRLTVEAVDLRDFTDDPHRSVDDRPFGGGPGMVMRPEPIVRAVEALEARDGVGRRILLTPSGRRLTQAVLQELALETRLLFVCGRYEGIDERVRQSFEWDEISLGDFVLSGGELAALVVLDGVARLLPGVLGHPDSAWQESFSDGLLEAPQYTRPRSFRGMEVPDVLLSGDHAKIAAWRRAEALQLTRERRDDLLRAPAAELEQARRPEHSTRESAARVTSQVKEPNEPQQ